VTPVISIKPRPGRFVLRRVLSATLCGITVARAFADASLTFTWDSNPDPDIIGYNLFYGTASRNYTFAVPVGLVTNATVSGLREGLTYFFANVAYTADGAFSDFSDEASQFIPLPNSPNAFAVVSGPYNGLFFETNQIQQTTSGILSLFVTPRGIYSGRLQSGNMRAPFHGQLDSSCEATNVLSGPNNISFLVQFRVDGNGQLTGQLSNGDTISSLTAERTSFNSRTLPAPFAGRYTCVLPGQGTDPSAPQAYGFGVARVNASGSAIFFGTLADGTRVTQSTLIPDSGVWPFYVPLYSGNGSILGLLTLSNQVSTDLNGMINWIKPAASNAKYYSGGFTNQSQMIGSRYSIPSPVTQPVLELPEAFIAFAAGDPALGFTNTLSIGRGSRVANQSPNPLTMTFSISTGTFTGNVLDPVSQGTMQFSGVVFQKNAAGYGLMFGANKTSGVLLGLWRVE
jgi:hypothetical protein